jgi:Mg2+ and Co2+ transporter CorA
MRERLRKPIYSILNDELMMVLAILLIPPTFFPYYFKLSPFILHLFHLTHDMVIGMFVLEYCAKLYVAESRKAHFFDPWHLLDFLIVLLAGADLLVVPFAVGRASPMLRLLRLSRFLRFMAIAGRTVKRSKLLEPRPSITPPIPRQMTIRIFEEGTAIDAPSQAEITQHIHSPADTWIDIQNFAERDVAFIGELLGIPKYVLTSKVIQESFPRVDYYKNCTTIYLRDSRLLTLPNQEISISAHGFVILCVQANIILTICAGESDILDRVMDKGPDIPEESFNVRVLYSILRRKIRDYEEIVRVLEHKTALLEEDLGGRVPKTFLRETFVLKRAIQKVLYNLWHFRQVLGKIRLKKVAFEHIHDETLELFTILHGEAEYLYETLNNVKDSLISIIELHINAVSFEMNRAMKILAVLTCLSMIPATIAGLLGENLVDQPFSITLPEIVFLVLLFMLLGLYIFWRKGWLR